MDLPSLIGIFGAVILVIGAAYPAKKVPHPVRSTKNWLFAIGGLVMLAYSILNYMDGGSFFFVILQMLVNLSSVLMMLDTDDRLDAGIIGIAGLALIIWSLTLFEGNNTIYFIIGLTGIGIGYILPNGTAQRNGALFLGSILIALFSYIEMNWIFFWLNAVFAGFAGWYALRLFHHKARH